MLAVCHSATGSTRAGTPCSAAVDARGAAEFADRARAGAFAVEQQRGVAAAGVARRPSSSVRRRRPWSTVPG